MADKASSCVMSVLISLVEKYFNYIHSSVTQSNSEIVFHV